MKAVRIDAYGALTEEDLPMGEGAGLNRAVGELVQLVADAVLRATGPSAADCCHTARIGVGE
ncbi:hypothetical protein [Nonomuraea sp. 10N515B]|uniref:hypothetical protein n=1 Tax=Nonomuraea sp. 10N515B TaxID=3457422 RepID=UPI003FCDA97C